MNVQNYKYLFSIFSECNKSEFYLKKKTILLLFQTQMQLTET